MKRAEEKTVGWKKALRTAGDVALYALLAVAVFVLAVSIVSKKDEDGTATVFGYQLRFVQSDSMEASEETDVSGYRIGSIRVKSCVFVERVPESEKEKAEWYGNLRVGDVLTFKYVYTKQETITHRIVRITEKEGGGYLITLEGDNKSSGTNVLSQTIDTTQTDSANYIVGRVTGQSYVLGLLVYAFQTPVGIICIVIVPCAIVIGLEILKLVRVFGKEKRTKLLEKQEEQANEIEELKSRLAELQRQTEEKKAESGSGKEPAESETRETAENAPEEEPKP